MHTSSGSLGLDRAGYVAQIEIAPAGAYPEITTALVHFDVARTGLNTGAFRGTDVHPTATDVHARLPAYVLDVNVSSTGGQ